MARSLTTRKPTAAQIRKLHLLLSQDLHPQQRRRAQVLLLYAEGLSAVDIAASLHCHPQTVYQDLRAFAQSGLDSLRPPPRGGTQRQISRQQESEILRLAQLQPVEVGLPFGRWSLTNLQNYLIKKRIIKRISREHLRRLLKKGGSDLFALSAKS